MTAETALEQAIRRFADELGQHTTLSPNQFDTWLRDRLEGLERLALPQPSLRDAFRKQCFDLCAYTLDSSYVLRRLRYKPLGYGGDYEAFDALYQSEGISFWDAFAKRQNAVKEFHQVAQLPLTSSRVLLVRPVYRGLVNNLTTFEQIDIVEPEPEAIQFAKELFADVSISFYERLEEGHHTYDGIYAPQLLNRLSSDALPTVLSVLWERLEPGGVILLYQLQPTYALRLFMKWCLDWTLEYHEQSHLENLCQTLAASVRVEQHGDWLRLELQK